MFYQLKVGGQDFNVEIGAQQADQLRVTVNGTPYDVAFVQPAGAAMPRVASVAPAFAGPAAPVAPVMAAAAMAAPVPAPAATPAPAAAAAPAPAAGKGALRAPIPGLIVQVSVQVGDTVVTGQTVAIMEAMKMENNLVAPTDGVVTEIKVQKGSEVVTGDLILTIG